MHTSTFPPGRTRGPGGPLPLSEVYERVQSFDELTCSNTDQTVGTFAGRPDSIVLSARTNPALFRLVDRLDRELDTIACPAGQVVETHVRADRVIARNQIGGSNAVVHVHGKWAQRAERSSGY